MIGVDARRALQSILTCRTEVMGGRRYHCDSCRRDHFGWHSCNHRLCPVCGAGETAAWVAARLGERLRVPHFMLTFTLPAQLRELCRGQPRERFLRLFFACASRAIKDVLEQPRHLGGKCGFFGIIQTWTQELLLHPHIHFIVPAVALGADGRIRRPKNTRWLARGEVFASRLRTLLLKALAREALMDNASIQPLWKIRWNCDVENFGSGENAMKYLGAYLCRGPIGDTRVIAADATHITISVKDRKSGQCSPAMIEGAEFVRRYLQHALPARFHRIRYYGFMHARAKAKLAAIRAQLGELPPPKTRTRAPEAQEHQPAVLIRCPHCKKPMSLVEHRPRAPPHLRSIPHIWNHNTPVAA